MGVGHPVQMHLIYMFLLQQELGVTEYSTIHVIIIETNLTNSFVIDFSVESLAKKIYVEISKTLIVLFYSPPF